MAHYMLVAVDDLTRHNYTYLTSDDECYYLCEYFSGMGYSYSAENQLIFNFKKPVQKKAEAGYQYKAKAIQAISAIVNSSVLPALDANTTTIVPIPPSKTKKHIHHDDRMCQVLHGAIRGTSFDCRELIIQVKDMDAAHDSSIRPRPEDLKDNYQIDLSLTSGLKDLIVLFDDVLTTGAHYVACRDIIKAAFPDKKVVGIFIARCNRTSRDLSVFDNI